MKYLKYSAILIASLLICATILPSLLSARTFPHPSTYCPAEERIVQEKEFFDDPRPIVKTFGPEKLLPKEMIDYLSYDVEKMKTLWAELVGFKSPDVVGKIAPEIKPGKYTWKDVQNNPGFKELFPEGIWERIREGGPPLCGAIPEFEIVPTQQYYFSLPVAEATKRNEGKAKLDENGYLIAETYDSGFPFPKPSGKFKGQQLMYNRTVNYVDYGPNMWGASRVRGLDKNLRVDYQMNYTMKLQRLGGRVYFEPFGFLNDRAKSRRELIGFQFVYMNPRDIAGMVWQSIQFQDAKENNQDMMYIPSLRRVRKLSATDTQDPMPGLSTTYDDVGIFNQKMTPDRFPMSFKITKEREYLMFSPTEDGRETYREKDGARLGSRFERRPVYLLEITELDPNYIYSKRIVYLDQEHLMACHGEYYDQKGRKYRSQTTGWAWFPKFGVLGSCGADWLYADHVDNHSEVDRLFLSLPANWPDGEISMKNMMEKAK